VSSPDDYEAAKRNYWLEHVTPQAIADALIGFSLPPVVSFDWISAAIKTVVPSGPSPFDWDGCEAFTGTVWPPNRTTARDAWKDLSGAIGDVFEIILEKQAELEVGISDEEVARIQNARAALGDLWDLARLREAMDPEPKKFRSTSAKELRIEQAIALSVIFKRAFNREATIDNREGKVGGPWPDFYRRIMALAFDARSTKPDEAVLRSARTQIRQLRKKLGKDAEGIFYPKLTTE
jgi:hypothetical protein